MGGNKRRSRLAGAGTAAVLLFAAAPAIAGQRLETLRFFDPSPAPSPVVGFRLYVGPDAAHTTSIDIGNPAAGTGGIRSYPLLLPRESNVYLALTAYDAAGRESAASNWIFRGLRGPAFDHDADGGSDLLRIDDVSGGIQILRRGSDVNPNLLPLGAPKHSSIVARGDFDANGTSDIVWQRKGSRALTLWLLGGDGSVDSVGLPTPGPRLRLLGVGDLDGNGHHDLIFQDAGNDELQLWLVGETLVPEQQAIEGLAEPWRMLGIGDVEADRRSDLVWWDPSSGAVRIWQMNGASILEDVWLPGAVRKGARPIGLGDYDADGAEDLLVQLRKPQWITFSPLWNRLGPASLIAVGPGPHDTIAAGGDFDADGYADLLLADPSKRRLTALLLGPTAGSLPPSDFRAASMSADLARELGDSDNDWSPDYCDADIDNDGLVGSSDFRILVACFGGLAVDACAAFDADGDGIIGNVELASITSRFGELPCAEIPEL